MIIDLSILIDELVNNSNNTNCLKVHVIGNRDFWYIAKPIQYKGFKTLKRRIRDAIGVLMGKKFAYHYYDDIKENIT